MTHHSPTPATTTTTYERCQHAVKQLTELTGIRWTFGYVGNIYGMPGSPAYRDDRAWSAFAEHPGRVGTHDDCIGYHRTDQLDELAVVLSGAVALARVQAARRAA